MIAHRTIAAAERSFETMSAVTRAIGASRASLPDQQGIPTCPIIQAWKGEGPFSVGNNGT